MQWLYEKVAGFSSRNESRTMAKRLLKEGYLKHTTGKSTFSEQCYYVFNLERISSSSAPSAAREYSNPGAPPEQTLDLKIILALNHDRRSSLRFSFLLTS